jgi:hypothetical protein
MPRENDSFYNEEVRTMTLWKRIYFWILKQRMYLEARRILKRPPKYDSAFDLEDPDYDFKTGRWNS